MRHSRLGMLALLTVATVAVAACSGGSAEIIPIEGQDSCEVRAVYIVPETASMHTGDTLLPTVSVLSCAATAARGVRWSSVDTSIAAVDSLTGLVVAKRAGHTFSIAAAVANHQVQGAMAVLVAP